MRRRRLLAAAAIAVAVAVVAVTWRRLFYGIDLQDEAFAVVTPWRWALGYRPFVDEMDLTMMGAALTYPFVKAFALITGNDSGGLVLFMRHLYLLFMVGVAAAVFLLLRRLVRWELALLVAAVNVGFVFWGIPDLTHNTVAAGLLTVGFTLGARLLVGGRDRRCALAAGLCHGLAVVAYPTLLFVMPFFAVFLAFALGRQATAVVALRDWRHAADPEPAGEPTGAAAWLAVSAYTVAAALPVALVGLGSLLFGLHNIVRSWGFTMSGAHELDQLGGAGKAVSVTWRLLAFIWTQPWFLLAAVAIYGVYRLRPRLGRALLVLLPPALLLAGDRPRLEAAGFVLIYGLLTPYLYLFVPRARRWAGARLLIWVWPSALVAGAMTAYTSADGFAHAPAGLYPAVMVSGLFLAWALEGAGTRQSAGVREGAGTREGAGALASAAPASTAAPAPASAAAPVPAPASAATPGWATWLAAAVLMGVLAVTLVLQLQYYAGDASRGELTTTMSSGPWEGIRTTKANAASLDVFAADLAAQRRAGDHLLIYPGVAGLYLYWDGPIAANSVRAGEPEPASGSTALPRDTVLYLRRRHVVPDFIVWTDRRQAARAVRREGETVDCGGLRYDLVRSRPRYVILRRPGGESTRAILDTLPRY